MTKKPTLISFFGGPGCGKSTASLALTSKMKDASLRAEFVSEFAKTLAWRRSDLLGQDALFPILFGRQVERIFLPANECDYIITDSPPWLCAAYAEKSSPQSESSFLLSNYIRCMHATGYGVFGRVVDIELIRGDREYLNCGRSQTREEACEMDTLLNDQYQIIQDEMRIENLWLKVSRDHGEPVDTNKILKTVLQWINPSI